MLAERQLLAAGEQNPVSVINAEGRSPVLLVCEHASHTLPAALGNLGLPDNALKAHIAWDPGALAVALHLCKSLDATLIYQNYSRLAYDCNRPPEAHDAMPEVSEIFEIPGNRALSDDQRTLRTNEIYHPFRQAIADMIKARTARGQATILATIHSFTPIYRGVARSVELGILHDADSRLADRMLAQAAQTTLFDVRRNEPYGPADGVTHTLKEHALANGLRNVMIEIRNDLIRNGDEQAVAADFLAGLLQDAG